MALQTRAYSVLIVSASEKFRQSAVSLLSESRCTPIQFAQGIGSARRLLAEQPFDFVIVSAPFPDDAVIRFAIEISDRKNTSELLLLPPDLYESNVERAISHGIFVLPKPVSKESFLTAIDWLAASREQLRKAEQKTLSIEDKMEEIRTVNRAKWLLISEKNMSEADAHRFIEKQAMDRCVTRMSVAQEILRIRN